MFDGSYDLVVDALRSDRWNALPPELRALVKQAADTIEELSAFRAQITDGNFYCMRDGVLYEGKVEPPKGKAIVLPPIKFAEPPKEET